MTHVSLAGGTDVAEVALFSVDALPERPEQTAFERLESEGFMMRFETGADGSYLLHAYIDEPVPDQLMKYCEQHDARTGQLRTGALGIGFGGIESAVRQAFPMANLRADALVPAGNYDLAAYRTAFPEQLFDSEVEAKLGKRARWLLNLPGYIIAVGVVAVGVSLFMGEYVAAAFAAALFFAGLKWMYFGNPAIKRLHRERAAIELQYPSIVVQMRSRQAATSTAEVQM